MDRYNVPSLSNHPAFLSPRLANDGHGAPMKPESHSTCASTRFPTARASV